MNHSHPRSFRIDARRRLSWILFIVGLGLLVSFAGSEYFGLEWLRIPYLPAYVSGLLGVLFLVLLFPVWRCPQCGRHLGRLDSKFCTHCGLALTRQASSDLTGRVDPERVRKEFDRIRDVLERLGATRRVIFLVGFIAGGGLFYLLNGMPGSLIDWIGLIILGVAAGATLSAGFHSLTILYYWRCPACGKHLPLKLGGFSKIISVTEVTNCPNCRVKLSEKRKS